MGDDVERGAMTGMGFLENITNGDRPIRLAATTSASDIASRAAQNPNGHEHSHEHKHEHGHQVGHTHGAIAPSIASSERGLWAVKWSFVGLAVTALLQAGVVWMSGSVALLADTIHNIGDAATAIPLGVAFLMARRQPSPRFSYGYGRVEDLAGLVIVGIITLSALITGYESIERILHPREVEHLTTVAIAALIGCIGNEAVALFRIQVGREIGSAALVADGYHARIDGLTSLAVLGSAIGVELGYTWADPVIGIGITAAIVRIVWDSAKTVLTRILDGVEPETIDTIRHAIDHVGGIIDVTHIRARWLGHCLHADIVVTVDASLSVTEAEAIATHLQSELQQHIPYLTDAIVQTVAQRQC